MLQDKLEQIHAFIRSFSADRGYPPTMREIGAAIGFKSPSTVHKYVKMLQERGMIEKHDGCSRAIRVDTPSPGRIPVLGVVAAGQPIMAVEQADNFLDFEIAGGNDNHFALEVRGDSMTGAGIEEGDYVIVHSQNTAYDGEIVVALLDEDATVKRLSRQGGHVYLLPENDAYQPIDGDDCRILGKVVAMVRYY